LHIVQGWIQQAHPYQVRLLIIIIPIYVRFSNAFGLVVYVTFAFV
jgi:hypothetical protein